MIDYETLEVRDEPGIATITLNRPEKRNALSRQLVAELEKALDSIARSPAQVLVLTGAGKAFCAGMDLEELKRMAGQSAEENLDDSRRMARVFRRLYEFPRPTIAAVNGAAIAGGMGLATMCDFTLAAPEAKLGYSEARIGFIPALVASVLVWQVGHKTARDLLLTARLLDAAEAERLGLVNQVVPSGQLLARAHELAEQLLENSPSSLAATKQLLNRFLSEALDRDLELAIAENARIRQTADFREGVSSFLEKRKPRWSLR
jgi:methylglutaconyl-CoA hydratase